VISVLAIGTKGWADEFLRAIKICSMPSFRFRWEVKPEVPSRKILWHVKKSLVYN
jgi:hypothetical protein